MTTFRQDFTDKAHNAIKPDSQKTFTEHVGDMVTGKADSAGSTLQPQQDKSTAQKLGDAASGQQLVPSYHLRHPANIPCA
jgi:Heat shock protein 9/12